MISKEVNERKTIWQSGAKLEKFQKRGFFKNLRKDLSSLGSFSKGYISHES